MESFNLENICRAAADAKKGIGCLNTNEKNEALLSVADALVKNEAVIIEANMKDMENGRQNGMKSAILDRLFLNGGYGYVKTSKWYDGRQKARSYRRNRNYI